MIITYLYVSKGCTGLRERAGRSILEELAMSANLELCQSACASNVRILSLKAFRICNKLVNMFKYHLINFLR